MREVSILADRKSTTVDSAKHHVVKGFDIGIGFGNGTGCGFIIGPATRPRWEQPEYPSFLSQFEQLALGSTVDASCFL